MAFPKFITQREGLVRTVSTVALAGIAIRSVIKGKRLRGLLAAGGAVAVGVAGSTLDPTPLELEREDESTSEASVTESTSEAGGMQCSVCDEPIVVGESRRPNEVDEIVHQACLD